MFALAATAPAAAAQSCAAYPTTYPGDNAAKAQIAAWMAGGAVNAGLPGELPVMGALVESGLTNLNYGDRDSAGYFGMRVGIWNNGPYAGFPDNPPLQLQWFIDQATKIRQQMIAAGNAAFGQDPATWGDWDADVLLPAEQYRGRYQLRLTEAQTDIAAGCATPPEPPPSGPPTVPTPVPAPPTPTTTPPPPDTTPPALLVGGDRRQDAAATGALLVDVTCPAETCIASATANLSLPSGAARVYRLSAKPRSLRRGQRTRLRLTLSSDVRGRLRRTLRRHHHIAVTVKVTVRDGAGNATTASRAITLLND